MNHIYRSIYNAALGASVNASENTKSRKKGSKSLRKRASIIAVAGCLSSPVMLAHAAGAGGFGAVEQGGAGVGSDALGDGGSGITYTNGSDGVTSSNAAVAGGTAGGTYVNATNAANENGTNGANAQTLPSGDLAVTTKVVGGGGGSGGNTTTNNASSGSADGGAGGLALSVTGVGSTVTNQASIVGGGGGGGGQSTSLSSTTTTTSGSANGGAGGDAINVNAAQVAIVNASGATIAGGAGGGGGWSTSLHGTSSVVVGGDGGIGVNTAASNVSITNGGMIAGGNGGSAGGSNGATQSASRGGAGGIGVVLGGSNDTLTNTGTIMGGEGGGSSSYGTPRTSGAGGVAVVMSGNGSRLVNSGLIAGGMNGSSTAYADAVDVNGSHNTVEINAGANFVGNVVSTSGNGNTLALGGTTSASFDLSQIVTSTPSSYNGTTHYYGFDSYQKLGSGTWTLTGSGAGNWTAQDGTLVLADSMNLTGTLAVLNGATISANNAIVSGAVTNAGTFTVNAGKTASTGAYTNSNGSTLRIGVAGMNSYGKLVVNGTAILTGSNLFVDAASATGMTGGTLSQIISATSITGTFASTSTNSLLFTYTPSYVGNQVNLVVAAAPSSNGSSGGIFKATNAQGNSPAAGAAGALDKILAANPNGSIASLFQGFTTGQERQLSNAVSQTLPLLAGSSQVATNSAFSGINRVVQARLDGNRGLSSGDEFLGDRNIWFKPFGSWANQGDRNGVSGFNASTYGVVAGIDRAWSEQVRAGVAFAYARSTVDANSAVAPQSSKVDVYQLIGYGSYSLDQDTELNFQGDISRNSNRSKRSLSFTSSVAQGSYDSTGLHVGAGLSRSFALSSATTLTPGVRADYTWLRDAGYAESGAGALNLNVDSRSASQLVLSTEGKVNLQLDQNTNLAFNAGMGYDTINKQASITSAYAGAPGASFVTYGLEQSPWIGRAGAALTYTTSGGVDLSLRYDLEARSSFTNQTASAKARWRF